MRWLAGPFRQSQQQTFLRRSKKLRTAQGVFLCQSSEVFEFFQRLSGLLIPLL
jgi:hypothetical protein